MELTKQRKILIGVVALGLIALVLDRMLAGPSEAHALPRGDAYALPDAGRPADNPQPAVAERPSPARPQSSAPAPLLHRMKETPEARDYEHTSTLDAFRAPSSWLPEPPPPAPEEPKRDTRVEDFLKVHRLTAVMSGSGEGVAVIGGTAFRIGDQLDGFTLIRIGARSVTFRSGDLVVDLVLPTSGTGN